jgi:hypothetical protein
LTLNSREIYKYTHKISRNYKIPQQFFEITISSSQVGNPTGLTTNTTTQRGLELGGGVREG